MDTSEGNKNPNPREKANPLSRALFMYSIDMFIKGNKTELEAGDLYTPIHKDKSEIVGDRLEKKWLRHLEDCERTQTKPSLLKVLAYTFWPEYTLVGLILFFLSILPRLVIPYALGQFLDYFRSSSDISRMDALYWASCVVFLNAVNSMGVNHHAMGAQQYGMRVRAGCCSLIYRKALRLSKTSLVETTSGKIVNLLSNDVSRFDMVSTFLNNMWCAPICTVAATYLLYINAGLAGLCGIVPIVLVTVFQSHLGKLAAKYRKQTAEKTDERIRMMDEIVSSVQLIKVYAWEIPFSKLIKEARRLELAVVTKASYFRSIFMTFVIFTNRAAIYCTLLAMALTDQKITASLAFLVTGYFHLLAQTLSIFFVRGITEIAEFKVAVKRIEKFLLSNEFTLADYSDKILNPESDDDESVIGLKDVSAKWNISSPQNAITNVTLSVKKGELVGIIGPVGSGKTSMLELLLGELVISSGKRVIRGTISYAAQEPWVFAATIRQNILFGSEYNEKRYKEVVRVCCLEEDFDQLHDGDLTLVGDRGASLSGGQKARVSLARAIYREADIYLLDDPLSAVDIHVSKNLYDNCINGYLSGKVRILVTHQVYYLNNAEKILILKDGKIAECETYRNLSMSDNDYAQLLVTESIPSNKEREQAISSPRKSTSTSRSSYKSALSLISLASEMSIPESYLEEDSSDDEPEEDEKKQELKKFQESSSKKIDDNIFLEYLHSGTNYFFIFAILCVFLLTQVLGSGVDYFVSVWTRMNDMRVYGNLSTNASHADANSTTGLSFQLATWSTSDFLLTYTGLLLAFFSITLWKSLWFYRIAISSSQTLHDNMFQNVIAATMNFFHTTTSGQILNRFSKDLGSIDEMLPKVILDVSQFFMNVAGAVTLVCIVNPYALIALGIIGGFLVILQRMFLKVSRNLKRIEGAVKAPVFSHLGASMNGLVTIRAFGAQKILSNEFDKHQDYHTSACYMCSTSSVSYGFFIDFICVIFVGVVTFSSFILGPEFGLEASQVGLAITQALFLATSVQMAMRVSPDVINQLTSVERVLEYNLLPAEQQPEIPKIPAVNWPQNGKIEFRHIGLRYEYDSPLILKDVNLIVKSNEKVGIVGRTGAGKSSLLTALFRLAPVEGHILIDNIDSKDLQLQTLRSRISIIPQDPVLFSGTLRYNLDPFEQYDDSVLYEALNEVELRDSSNELNQLENVVRDKGSNYSVGQRQLICLARAIVRKNKILLLDEATSNVDPQTDALIQRTIRTRFAECTVLTVAHRLNTIMDSDKILVMDSGTVTEFDHPHILLQDRHSKFNKMVTGTGEVMSEQLRAKAKQYYRKTVKSDSH